MNPNEPQKVLDHGFVRMDAALADDLAVVNAARVSFLQKSTEMKVADVGLIGFLMRERHGSPFEHASFRFHIKCPIFVAREWMRHRIGSYNEHSQRYSAAITDTYLPELEDIRHQVGKPGAYTYEPMDRALALLGRAIAVESYEVARESYERLLAMGVAKEVARNVLPVATYTEFYWSVNARALMNFLSLRNAPNALLEIRRYAEVLEEIFKETMPVTAEAFIQNGRRTP